MLYALGMFTFGSDTALPDNLSRQRDWEHERTRRFGARAASQFTGPGDDKITLAGTLIPELAGTYSSIETIAAMADEGEALPLLDGQGNKIGTFVILGIREDKQYLIDDGRARQNAFTIDLSRVD